MAIYISNVKAYSKMATSIKLMWIHSKTRPLPYKKLKIPKFVGFKTDIFLDKSVLYDIIWAEYVRRCFYDHKESVS